MEKMATADPATASPPAVRGRQHDETSLMCAEKRGVNL